MSRADDKEAHTVPVHDSTKLYIFRSGCHRGAFGGYTAKRPTVVLGYPWLDRRVGTGRCGPMWGAAGGGERGHSCADRAAGWWPHDPIWFWCARGGSARVLCMRYMCAVYAVMLRGRCAGAVRVLMCCVGAVYDRAGAGAVYVLLPCRCLTGAGLPFPALLETDMTM